MLEQKRKVSYDLYHKKKYDLDFKLNQLVRGAKQRSKIQSIPFDIDFEHVRGLWDASKGHCVVSGKPFDISSSDTYQNKNAPSLDKIDPQQGYVKGNVRLVTWHVNAAILNFGLDTFLELCRDVLNHNKEIDG